MISFLWGYGLMILGFGVFWAQKGQFTRQQQKNPKRSCLEGRRYRRAWSFLQDFCFAQFGYFQADKAQLYKVQKETAKRPWNLSIVHAYLSVIIEQYKQQ